jgi:hypothetical protein
VRITEISVCVAAVLALGGCYGGPPGATLSVDEDAILSTLQAFDDSPAFVRLNQSAYPTALPSQAMINVWVSSHAYAPYAMIVPDAEDSGVLVPEGTLLVREVLGDSGAVETLTLMYKGPEGYNPDLGDWWFGVTDTAGVPTRKDGVRQAGRLEACYSCHLDRAGDDFLFGVPATTRSHPAP